MSSPLNLTCLGKKIGNVPNLLLYKVVILTFCLCNLSHFDNTVAPVVTMETAT